MFNLTFYSDNIIRLENPKYLSKALLKLFDGDNNLPRKNLHWGVASGVSEHHAISDIKIDFDLERS